MRSSTEASCRHRSPILGFDTSDAKERFGYEVPDTRHFEDEE